MMDTNNSIYYAEERKQAFLQQVANGMHMHFPHITKTFIYNNEHPLTIYNSNGLVNKAPLWKDYMQVDAPH